MNRKKNLFKHLPVRFSLGFIALAALTLTACNKEEVKTPPDPVAVQAVQVEPQTVPVSASFVAQVESSHQVEIMARVNGFLDKILYNEGDVVKQGEKLFLMDQKPFIAQVEAARGALSNNEAQLWTAQANLNRIKPLAELDAASKSDLDNAIGSVKSAKAAVHTARARLEQTELDLSYTCVGDEGLGCIACCTALESLVLVANPRVGDQGLTALASSLLGLKQLNLAGCCEVPYVYLINRSFL